MKINSAGYTLFCLIAFYIFLGGCNEDTEVKIIPSETGRKETVTVATDFQKEETGMTNPNVLVERVRGIAPQPPAMAAELGELPPQLLVVSFHSRQSGLLDMSQSRSAVWAEVLDSLHQENQPAYVEIDPESNIITELLIPISVTVGEIHSVGEDVEVELIISQAKHFLRSKHPDFQRFLSILQDAQRQGTQVVVTESDEHEIIDVRPLVQPEEGGR